MIKITLVGESNVGKSTLLSKLISDDYLPLNETDGISFKTTTIKDNRLMIWDISGKSKFRIMAELYYRTSDIVLIIINTSILSSLKNISSWYNHIKKQVSLKEVFVGILIIHPSETNILSCNLNYLETIHRLKLPFWIIDNDEDIFTSFKNILSRYKYHRYFSVYETSEDKCIKCNIL